MLTAAEALEIGLITRVVPDDELAGQSLALARSLAGGATTALGAAKRLVWSGLGARVEAQLPEELAPWPNCRARRTRWRAWPP